MAQASRFHLTVRGPDNKPYQVEVTPETSVWTVKNELRRRTKAVGALDIIFNGDILQDEKDLKGLGIFSTSTLHCIRATNRPPTGMGEKMRQLDLASVPPELVPRPDNPAPQPSDSSGDPPHQFYVYCKDQCEAIAPGKLRVRCADCREGKFILDVEPSGWPDILGKRKMTGDCHRDSCKGKYAEFYFKCASHDTDEMQSSPALPMFRRNNYGIECPLCSEIKHPVAVFECPDSHVICYDCFENYCRTNLTDRNFVKDKDGWYTLSCPFPGHQDYFVKDIHHFRILGKENYLKYKDLATTLMVLQMGGMLCPRPGCGEGLLPEHPSRKIQCTSCKFAFCRECRDAFHQGKCSADRAQAEAPRAVPRKQIDAAAFRNARWETANRKYLKDKTKPCPQCKANTEKNKGCMHMTCLVCRFEWCWMCSKQWSRQCQDSHWFG